MFKELLKIVYHNYTHKISSAFAAFLFASLRKIIKTLFYPRQSCNLSSDVGCLSPVTTGRMHRSNNIELSKLRSFNWP
ncbi:MAG: hypothetical protein A2928_03530 [Candidatus Taylorbacteria bacterium RIFCSPLOWO2_01_FULL_45_15b]|uniref:Uncharacterized protein n=1 Tax=Candidatus Taylorbacteria bacterium RIFCSPLOWO2_01_FULL_45_15b TaxID=1802319 RepID=A0A1G2N928_9BACT|nr:MAG: hypothetical protein A2928_03530 [Candidatus Taylorbacteria bacterium RIFCSPLOWO2_01_FULL_45_15b]